MKAEEASWEDHKQRISSLSCLKWLLSLILLFVILDIYFNQDICRSALTTQMRLSERNPFPQSDVVRCIVHAKEQNGRFGNRMFLVASAYGLARLHSCHLYLTTEIQAEMQDIFSPHFSSLLLSSTAFQSMVNESNPESSVSKYVQCEYLRYLTRPNGISEGEIFELIGYWQSYLYFLKYANELRQNIFIPKTSTLRRISRFFLAIYQKKFHFKPHFSFHRYHKFKRQLKYFNQVVWIGIHVRRTDFVALNFSSSDEYLFHSIQYYTERYPDAHFIVASDDKSYCRNLFRDRSNIFITPRSFSVGEDLIALSLCQHSIATSGTFGWWAAFLTNGEVTHDNVYSSGCKKPQHYYPPWFVIDEHVRARTL